MKTILPMMLGLASATFISLAGIAQAAGDESLRPRCRRPCAPPAS